jgi:hypothetical protein
MQELDEHIDKNIKEWPVEGGFKVPEGYFEDLKLLVYYQTLYEQPTVKEYLSGEYFEKSRQQILEKTIASKPAKPIALNGYLKYLSLAASVLLVAGSMFWIFKPQQKSIEYPQLTQEEIIGYLEQDAMRELAVEEFIGVASASEPTIETTEEDYIILETL